MIEFLATLQWAVLLQIVMIDILLGGDNAVAIALACRKLDARQRKRGIMWGVAGAVGMRLLLVVFALQLLQIPLLKVTGGVLLLWIGIKLLRPTHDDAPDIRAGHSVWAAVKTILIADFVMSLDNVIGIAGATQIAATQHQMGYVLFGLVLSVPIIVWGSTLVLKLIDRWPLVITLGAGLLGWIAGGMLLTDVFIIQHIGAPSTLQQGLMQIAGAAFVIIFGKFLGRSMKDTKQDQERHQTELHQTANEAEKTNGQSGNANMTLLKWLALLGIVGIAAYMLLRQFTAQ